MLFNYLKVAWRILIKQKGYSFINILGLSVGLASFVLIFMFIKDELGYDNFHPHADYIFGVGVEYTDDQGGKAKYGAIPSGWTPLMKEQIPEVHEVVRITTLGYPYSLKNVENDRTILTQDGEVFIVENTYGDVLQFSLLFGNKANALSEPNSIVLSESAAVKLFGEKDVIGRQLKLKHIYIGDEFKNLIVTGVMEDYPENAHLRPDYLLSVGLLENSTYLNDFYGATVDEYLTGIDKHYIPTYIRLKEGANIDNVEKGLDSIVDKFLKDDASQNDPFLTNIKDFHFDEDLDWSWWDGIADFNYILIFGSIGFVILAIACINYMNLATAKSVKRSNEVGVRKTFGSSRLQLIVQFLNESLLTTLIALFGAFLIILIALPAFNNLAGKNFAFSSIFQWDIILFLILLWIFVGIIAGSYPAVFLSKFSPYNAIKGRIPLGSSSPLLRRILVVTQFVISAFLILSTGVILKQMNMLRGTKLYESADQIVSVRFGGGGDTNLGSYKVLKRELLTEPGIKDVTLAIHLPQRENFAPLDASIVFPQFSGEKVYDWKKLNGDYDFPQTFELEFIAGRDFGEQASSDSNNFILNETAVEMLDREPGDVIGYNILDTASNQTGTVIGVVKDFPYESIRTNIKPLAIQGRPHPENQIMYVKLPTKDVQDKLSVLEAKWKEILPGAGFDYWFLSEEFQRMYFAELKMARIIKVFSLLAIFVACLGLYGLASYTTELRTKEIGIRKVLGARTPDIIYLLVAEFLKMVVISCLIALPVGFLIMDDWLQNFVYKVNMGWGIFIISVLIILGLTLLTVSYESIKAAIADPSKSIKHE